MGSIMSLGLRLEKTLMRKQLYWLSDAESKRLQPLLPRGRRSAHPPGKGRFEGDLVEPCHWAALALLGL